jgi:hypothetical protein
MTRFPFSLLAAMLAVPIAEAALRAGVASEDGAKRDQQPEGSTKHSRSP